MTGSNLRRLVLEAIALPTESHNHCPAPVNFRLNQLEMTFFDSYFV